MKSKIKNIFHAHHGNQFKPYILRTPVVLLLVLGLLALQYFVLSGDTRNVLGFSNTVKSSELLVLTNNEREARGLEPLVESQALNQSALLKAEHMLANDYWSHDTPDGQKPWIFFDQADYEYRFAGENLAYGFITSSGVISGWMNSEGHKENLLSENYSEVGFAVLTGEFQGSNTVLIVAHYAQPLVTTVNPNSEITGTSQGLPTQKDYGALSPLSPVNTLNWSAQLMAIIAGAMGVLYMSQHVVIIKHRVAWDRAVHQHPLLRSFVFLLASAMMIYTSFGSVG